MKFSGPSGIRTRDLFSVIEEQVGEKGENAVHYVYYVPKSPYNSLRSLPAVLAYLFSNCSRRVPDMHRYEARNGGPQTCPKGEIILKEGNHQRSHYATIMCSISGYFGNILYRFVQFNYQNG